MSAGELMPVRTPGAPRLLMIDDDAMEPTLKKGDAVLVAPADRFSHDGLYVVEGPYGDPLVLRCATDFAGHVVIWRDNPAYGGGRYEYEAQAFSEKVLGRVVALVNVLDRAAFAE